MRALSLTLLLCACDAASSLEVENDLDVDVLELWWQTTLVNAPVAPGATSDGYRTVPGKDFAWAVTATAELRSTAELELPARGDVLHVVVSKATFADVCSLSAADIDLSMRIFPDAGVVSCAP